MANENLFEVPWPHRNQSEASAPPSSAMKVMKAMNPQFVLCKVFFFSFGEHDETLGKDLRENEQCRGPIRPEEMLGLHHAPAESASTEAVRLYRASHPGVFFPFI